MENQNSKQLLGDPGQIPGEALFREIMNETLFQTYNGLQEIISGTGLSGEWRYYNDGKAWLYKVTLKKKTVAWVSMWEESIKTSFYFTDKNRDGIMDLDIGESVKTAFSQAKPIGKLIPLTLDLKQKEDAEDFRKIAEYKISLK
jgi:hypothetical protein